MTIKVALSAALLVALVALAGATTTSSESQCRRLLQGRQLRACQSYLTQPQYEDVLEMVTRNPQAQPQGYVQECCQSLKEIEQQQQQCGCEAVRHALRQAQLAGQTGQVYQRAQMLPNICGLRSQQCQINVIFV